MLHSQKNTGLSPCNSVHYSMESPSVPDLSPLFQNFQSLPLEEMDKSSFLNRYDRKYVFHRSLLPLLLQQLYQDYELLAFRGAVCRSYSSDYYDTADNRTYFAHHRGRLNRFKIRRRHYLDTGDVFIEIKMKNNRGRTDKKRLPLYVSSLTDSPETDAHSKLSLPQDALLLPDFPEPFKSDVEAFLKKHLQMAPDDLRPVLHIEFQRLMLIHRQSAERCSIDFDLSYSRQSRNLSLPQLVVLERKSGRITTHTALDTALSQLRIKPTRFSKYCFGRSVCEPDLKQNLFLERNRKIHKIAGAL